MESFQCLNDAKQRCSLQWLDMYTHLGESPDVYTREKLQAYKPLDAYKFVVCGHVQDKMFYSYNIEDVIVALKAEVLPNQIP